MSANEVAINLAIKVLERSHDDEFCVMVDIRNENNETTHFSEEIYYSAEFAVKAYMARVAEYGEDNVDLV